MNDKNTSDERIDEITFRIRNAPVPDYPAQQLLDSIAMQLPEPDRGSSGSWLPAPRKIIAVSCSVVVLLLLATGLLIRGNSDGISDPLNPIARDDKDPVPNQITAHIEPNDLKIGPMRVVAIDTAPAFNRMTDQLARLDARLQVLATQVALQEVKSDAATLLAEYAPRKSTVK